MDRPRKKLKDMIEVSLIASIYTVLTFFAAIFGVAYSGFQFRISEIMVVLPVISPNAILGLTLGCFISNLSSPFGIVDVIFGSLSTFIASILTRHLKDIKIKGIPILSPLPPVVIGAIYVGLMVSFFNLGKFYLPLFLTVFFNVFFSQFIVCYVLGIPFLKLIEKRKIYERGV